MIDGKDIQITCPCGFTFLWTVRDQAFYREKGFSQPKRCKACAAKRRQQGAGHREKGRQDAGQGIWR